MKLITVSGSTEIECTHTQSDIHTEPVIHRNVSVFIVKEIYCRKDFAAVTKNASKRKKCSWNYCKL